MPYYDTATHALLTFSKLLKKLLTLFFIIHTNLRRLIKPKTKSPRFKLFFTGKRTSKDNNLSKKAL